MVNKQGQRKNLRRFGWVIPKITEFSGNIEQVDTIVLIVLNGPFGSIICRQNAGKLRKKKSWHSSKFYHMSFFSIKHSSGVFTAISAGHVFSRVDCKTKNILCSKTDRDFSPRVFFVIKNSTVIYSSLNL